MRRECCECYAGLLRRAGEPVSAIKCKSPGWPSQMPALLIGVMPGPCTTAENANSPCALSKGACVGRPGSTSECELAECHATCHVGRMAPSATAIASPPAVPVQIPDVGMPVTWDNAAAPKATCPWALISGMEKGLPPENGALKIDPVGKPGA